MINSLQIVLEVGDVQTDQFSEERLRQSAARYAQFEYVMDMIFTIGKGFYMNGKMVGLAVFYPIRNNLYVAMVMVNTECQNMGIGTAIFKYFSDLCVREKLDNVICEYRREDKRLKRFYKKLQKQLPNLKCKRI